MTDRKFRAQGWRSLWALSAGILLTTTPARAGTLEVDPMTIDAHLRYLSSDLLEGRAPATRGGQLTEEYIAAIFQTLGLQPGAQNGSYFQSVPVRIATLRSQALAAITADGKTRAMRVPEDAVLWSERPETRTVFDGDVVFVGYGITAPEYRWDDFKHIDLKGKILLVLINDPPAPADEPQRFGGRGMTYYGRWTYKFEEAERRGALGVILVHTTERAGYPWHTVVGSWGGPQRFLPRETDPKPLAFRAWITEEAAIGLLAGANLKLDDLTRRAARRDFQPVTTGVRVQGSFESSTELIAARNVMARLPGADPKFSGEAVIFTAHHDHLGIGPAVDGDTIYNGASDNASGVADLLAMAGAAVHAPRPKRTLYFAAVTAEESGLLGSEYLVAHPPVPVERLVANFNIDGGNLLGRTRDIVVQGEQKSTLGDTVRQIARPQQLVTSPDPFPERGYFYRSDHFSFARAGVPSVSIAAGLDFIGKPRDWGRGQADLYIRTRYHQPSDEYRAGLDLSGAVQLSRLVLSAGIAVANASGTPSWKTASEFQRRSPKPGGVAASP